MRTPGVHLTAWIGAFAVVVSTGGVACSPSKKVQCEQLNLALAPIESEKSIPPSFSFHAERLAYATKLDSVAEKVEALKITDPAVLAAAREYARAARALAEGYKQENLLAAAGTVSARSVELANAYGQVVDACGPANAPKK